MTRESSSLLTRRAMMGSAGVVLAVPLTNDLAAVGQPLVDGALQLRSLADLADPAGAEGVGTKRGRLASVIEDLPFHARDFGVVGDGIVDDTRAAQSFLDQCAKHGGRIAHFGVLCVRITGPLKSRGVGIVFDPASYGTAGAPGFVASGSAYTALTVTGSVSDFCVTLTGDGTVDITGDGAVSGDRRPQINGIAFGLDDDPFALSTVRSVRVNNLAGFGVRNSQCWDSTFLSVSVERCGGDGVYAFEIAGNAQRTCNETIWMRLHVEQAIGGAIRIDPGALSCSFFKIHSERVIARRGTLTWLFGGSCVFDSVRLTAMNPVDATAAVVSNQANFRNLRAEQGIKVSVNASGGTVTFNNPGAVLTPAPDQSGTVNVIGGVVSILAMGGDWNLFGTQVGRLEVGFMPRALRSTLTGCSVAELMAQPGADQGELILHSTRVAAATIAGQGRLRALYLNDGSRIAAKGGTLHCADQAIAVDASSAIEGNASLQRVTLRLAGTITGNLAIQGLVHDARADDGAIVGGTVTGWGAPTVAGSVGAWSVNLAPATGLLPGGPHAIVGWRYIVGAWRPIRMTIES